jgi:hypothetical protein
VDESVIEQASDRLLAAVDAELAGWIERRARELDPGSAPDPGLARACADDAVRRLRELLATDIDAQRSTPLQVVRDAIEADVAPRDVLEFGPVTWADLGEDVGDAGLAWGAAKAMVHLRRHRPEGG